VHGKHVLILGATGRTGQHLVTQGLEAGHEITALVRRHDALLPRERLRVAVGELNAQTLGQVTAGQDAVISALGRGQSFKSEALIQTSVPPILAAMLANGVHRLIWTSGIGAGETARDAPLFSRLFARTLLRDIYADKIAGEDMIRGSALDWTIVQPAQLTNGPLTRTYRHGERLTLSGLPKISRADTADFILRELEERRYVRKTVLLAY
jgi:putative NADH-flavin reductase